MHCYPVDLALHIDIFWGIIDLTPDHVPSRKQLKVSRRVTLSCLRKGILAGVTSMMPHSYSIWRASDPGWAGLCCSSAAADLAPCVCAPAAGLDEEEQEHPAVCEARLHQRRV